MNLPDIIQNLIRDHARYSWSEDANQIIKDLPISYVGALDAGRVTSGLCIPIDIPFDPTSIAKPHSFFGSNIQPISPLRLDLFPDYCKTDDCDWLWKNKHGAVMLSFNLAGYIDYFISGNKKSHTASRDAHGRLLYKSSALKRLGLESQPTLNKYLYAILAIANGRIDGQIVTDPANLVLPPVLVLSHDCDQLRGNDLITQAIRIYRLLAPIASFKMPSFRNIWYLIQNFFYPRRFYFYDALAMQDIEFQFGFRSIFYFLNGTGGRFGARSGSPIIREFAKNIRSNFEIGVHYNYQYAFDPLKLKKQIDEISHLTGRPVISGRAHYLIFDPLESAKVLAKCGIRVDESIGFVEENSFRLGFAGAFRSWSGLPDEHDPLVEIPLSFMDRNTIPCNDENDFYKMIAEVEKFGGLISIVFHPGYFNNPEFPKLQGQYMEHLNYFHKKNYRCMLPSEVETLLTA